MVIIFETFIYLEKLDHWVALIELRCLLQGKISETDEGHLACN